MVPIGGPGEGAVVRPWLEACVIAARRLCGCSVLGRDGFTEMMCVSLATTIPGRADDIAC